MKKQSLYKDLAEYYDLIYAWKDYKKDVTKLTKLIANYKKSQGNELLDVACGTGHHLQLLERKFSCTGIDVNDEILRIAKTKLKSTKLHKANMIHFSLQKRFDIILCLFSSIGYVKTKKNLEKTIASFERHLLPGGVLIIEPWFTKSTFKPGYPFLSRYETKDLKIARVSASKVSNNVSIMDMHYLIGEKDKGVKHSIDRHELGLFDTNSILKSMRSRNIKAMYIKNGLMDERGLIIGIKQK